MGAGRLDSAPWLRAALDAFAEQVRGLGPVLDAGCGPGDASGYLHERGVQVTGIDLSPRMVGHARRLHPQLTFDVASVTEIAPAAESLGGVLGWWSWFNLPRAVLPQVIARMTGALRPGGHLLIGTHVGEGDLERTTAYGDVPVHWTTHLYQPEELTTLLTAAGLTIAAELRLPSEPPQHAQVIISARTPSGGPPHLEQDGAGECTVVHMATSCTGDPWTDGEDA
ncbi:class I SAM-dependent methyltransferase [Nakamurella sp. YIM 132084]|uniref:Class I SAM-dependent methyltransferase n=2 Tax=Nakamurella leprariae TaxID=2803911 RepID=A0A939C2K9_9ACTN|nr:class I SAM-dependent methyltransferase [Nakamurella leprariae]